VAYRYILPSVMSLLYRSLPLKAATYCCRVLSVIPLWPLARTLIRSASSMRVLSELNGSPTPVHNQHRTRTMF